MKVQFTETVLRDANQSLIATRLPFDKLEGEYKNYKVTDLLTGRVIAMGYAEGVDNFSTVVPYTYCGVYLVEGIN